MAINKNKIVEQAQRLTAKGQFEKAIAEYQKLVKSDPADPSTWRLNANRIELEDDLLDDDFESGRIEIEGMIQRVVPDASPPGGVIVIDGVEIRVDDINLFRVGLRVEMHGTRQAGQVTTDASLWAGETGR